MTEDSFNFKSNIRLVYNHGYTWYDNGEVLVKGWAIDDKGFSYEDSELAEYFLGIKEVEILQKSIEKLSGHFSVVIRIYGGWLAAVDRCRSFPLYYSENDKLPNLSDSAFEIANPFNLNNKFDKIAIDEYCTTGHVLGNKTFFERIYQISAGDIVHFVNGSIQCFPYFRYLTDKQPNYSFDEASTLFVDHLDKLFNNLIKSLKGRKVIIPLSGGYDSRLIASMFRRCNYSNVLCYTFGKKGNPEMLISEKVARTLNFPWMFFETTPEVVEGFAESDRFLKYAEFAANADSFYIIQDFFAVKKMYDENLIPPDSVFMPGHSGDTLGGSNFLGAINGYESRNGIAEQIIKHKFDLRDFSKHQKEIFKSEIYSHLDKYYGNSYLWYDCWSMSESHPKLFVNATKVYDYFGYRFYLPLWDNSLLFFFKNLPFELKKDKNLYDLTLETKIFNTLGVHFNVSRKVNKRNLGFKIMNWVKSIIKFLFPTWFIYKYCSYDPINGKIYAHELVKDMSRKGYKISYTGTNTVKAQWYIKYIMKKYER